MDGNGNSNKKNDKGIAKKHSHRHNFFNTTDSNGDFPKSTTGNGISDAKDLPQEETTRTEADGTTDKTETVTPDDITIIDTDNDSTTTNNKKGRVYRQPVRIVNDLVRRKTAVLMIFTFLNAGVSKTEIKTMIEAHGLLETHNVRDGNSELFGRYIHEAEEMKAKDYGHTAWITAKIQTGFNEDYHDALEVLTKRIDDNKENRDYFQHWAKELILRRSKSNELLGVMSIINDLDKTVANLLKDRNSMIEGGPMMYKTKKYLDLVHELLESKGVHFDKNQMLPSGNVIDNIDGSPRSRLKKQSETVSPTLEEENQKEFKIAPHLKQIEKEMGKKFLPNEDQNA